MLLLLLVLEAIPLVLSQATHTVSVGALDSVFVFDPPTLTVGTNDTINFLFLGDAYSVTQSSADAPCSPLRGGFSSNFLGRGVNFTGPPVMWSLKVTNTSAPIWYFCSAITSVCHCDIDEGTVGVINPPSQGAFGSFQTAAKSRNPPAFSPSLVLQGVGAIATFPVILTDTAGTAASRSTNTGIPTSSINMPLTPPQEHESVIGGAIGGVLGVVSISAILCCYCIKRRRKRSVSSTSYFADSPHPHPLDTAQLETSTCSVQSSPPNSDSTITNNWIWEEEGGVSMAGYDSNRGKGSRVASGLH